jgi:hypothetical protein
VVSEQEDERILFEEKVQKTEGIVKDNEKAEENGQQVKIEIFKRRKFL